MKRLLVIEDEENERFTLSRLLERAGYAVTAYGSADTALDALATGEWYAVVTDVMMPGTDGLSLAREIAARKPGLPIVLTSAFHMGPSQLERMAISPLHFIDKPLDLDQLLAILEHPERSAGRRTSYVSLPSVPIQRPG